jgi:glycosyltransferase involved in cell wall biosynthesis
MKTLSVVVPVYFNEESLPELFQELRAVEQALGTRGLALELIFVDDGSRDQSYREMLRIKEQRPATRLVKLTRNFGAVHAVKAGLQLVTGDCFMWIAADCQDPPEVILTMAEKWLQGSKYTVAVRESREDPLGSTMFSKLYYRLVRLMVAKDYPTGGYDMVLMDSTMLDYLKHGTKNMNMQVFAFWLGFTPTVVTYERRERRHGRSRFTFSKRVKFMLDSLLGFSLVPIRAISYIGVVVSLLSFAYGLLVVRAALFGERDVPGWSSVAALVSFLLGLAIVMLGVIGEYVWRIFDEVNRRPESVIEDIR